MDKELTSLEILAIAMQSEEEASRFYGHMAGRIGNELVKTRFRHLAEEEAGHRKMLSAFYKRLTGSEEAPPRVTGDIHLAEGEAASDDARSIEDLLQLAIRREESAKEFYRQAAEKATDPSGERMLHYLADVELGHAQLLRRELDAYHRDTGWYTGEASPEMVHVGP